ncbi:hypothetical protein [Actinomadura sp. DC4]|uniref:hypothetical protein n=1 Tax=Actinomadura sp. DC4 TaxID=3055069 RepID=UPI0025B17690|nr:hypothetical protein [Actinomadura sp. DC4]MDN3355829.1 hypothetical protein [Actinomadura sp. DC4]
MNHHERLSEDDYRSIHQAGHALAEQGWRRAFTLNQMLDAWQDLVEDLQEGYDGTFAYEWHHDLRCRDWLHAAWPMLTHRIQELRRPQLQALDDRYREVTVLIRTSGRPPSDPGDLNSGWWHGRHPRVIHTDHPHDGLPAGWSPPETPIS